MVQFIYKIGCRSCLNSDGANHMYAVIDKEEQDYNNSTELDVKETLTDWLLEEGSKCQFCGSNNIELMDISVNGRLLYDFDSLAYSCQLKNEEMLMVNIDKTSSGIVLKLGGSNNPEYKFTTNCYAKIINYINNLPDYLFEERNKGNAFFCLTGYYKKLWDNKILFQTAKFHGFTKKEIISSIKKTRT